MGGQSTISTDSEGGDSAGSGADTAGAEVDSQAGSSADSQAGSSADSQAGSVDTSSGTAEAAPDPGVAAQGPAGLAAEAAAALEGAGVDPVAAQALTSEGSWKQLTPPVCDIVCVTVFPQWNIGKDERGAFADPLAECLEQVFPGGMEGKHACWVKLILAGGGIFAARALSPGGVPPLFHHQRKSTPKPAQSTRDPATLTTLTPDA